MSCRRVKLGKLAERGHAPVFVAARACVGAQSILVPVLVHTRPCEGTRFVGDASVALVSDTWLNADYL